MGRVDVDHVDLNPPEKHPSQGEESKEQGETVGNEEVRTGHRVEVESGEH